VGFIMTEVRPCEQGWHALAHQVRDNRGHCHGRSGGTAARTPACDWATRARCGHAWSRSTTTARGSRSGCSTGRTRSSAASGRRSSNAMSSRHRRPAVACCPAWRCAHSVARPRTKPGRAHLTRGAAGWRRDHLHDQGHQVHLHPLGPLAAAHRRQRAMAEQHHCAVPSGS
jgi:hypothetical protein